MGSPTRKRLLVLRTTGANWGRVHAIARWARALVPAAALVVTPFDGSRAEVSEEDSITLDVDQVRSGPLSLADALSKAVAASLERAGPAGE
jgi:hypothetical protein